MKQLALEYIAAKQKYQQAVLGYVRSSLTIQDKFLFWSLLSDLCRSLKNNLFTRTDALKVAAEEFFDEHVDIMPQFIKTYAALKEKLFKTLACRGELVDALPLAGKSACLRIIAKDYDDLTSLVYECEPRLADMILESENHVEQTLENVYVEKLCYNLVQRVDEQAVDENV